RVAVDLADDPEVARTVLTSLSTIFFEMGRLDAAERHARRALELFGDERGPAYGHTAQVLATALSFNDATEASLRYFEEAMTYLRGIPEHEIELAAIFNKYGDALISANREAEAEHAYQDAIAIYRAHDRADSSYSRAGLALLYNDQGRYDDALPLLREVVGGLRQRHAEPHYELGEALGNLASTLSELERVDEALLPRREALAIFEATVGEEHPSAVIQRTTYASDLLKLGQVEAAQREAQHALDASLRAFGADHSYTAFAQNVAG